MTGPRRSSFRVGRPAAGPEAITAAIAPVYDVAMGDTLDLMFEQAVEHAGYVERLSSGWPTEQGLDVGGARVLARNGDRCAVLELADGSLAHVHSRPGEVHVAVAAGSQQAVQTAMAAFQQRYPATQLSATDERVPITFWTYTAYGPSSRLRMIDAQPWQDISRNYTGAITAELGRLMGDGFEPGKDGQLLLWQGPPGTGKTWALRALASEWLPWAEFHYITDPDAFFVTEPSYMVDVLLADEQMALSPDGEVFDEQRPEGKWRVLILEDTGELLAADARDRSGQGLSRLLNVVDGLIGQGLRVLCLVTTNDELGDLNAAVRRPGRCASQLVFGPLSAAEASAWSGGRVEQEATLAELYAAAGAPEAASLTPDAEPDAPTVTMTDSEYAQLFSALSRRGSVLTAVGEAVALAMVKGAKVEDAIAACAEEQNPLAVDNGQTAWNPDTKTVLWIASDSTGEDDVAAASEAFLAIDGVENFEYEHEGMPTGWCDAKVVYGGQPFDCGTEDAALEAAIDAEVAAIADAARVPLRITPA